jgi:hypothetical protein
MAGRDGSVCEGRSAAGFVLMRGRGGDSVLGAAGGDGAG